MSSPEPMSDHDFRMALTKALRIGRYHACTQEQLLDIAYRYAEDSAHLHALADKLGFDVRTNYTGVGGDTRMRHEEYMREYNEAQKRLNDG